MTPPTFDILTVITAVGSALVGGVMFAFSTLVMGGLRRLSPAEGIRAMQQINTAAVRPAFMTAFLGTGALCLVLGGLTVFSLEGPGAVLRLIGCASYLLTIAITVGFHIPRNVAIDALDPAAIDAPARWQRYLAEWIPGNHVRVLVATAAAVLLIVSLPTG